MLSKHECRVYFALDGDDFDPDEVTNLLGIEPTSIRREEAKGNSFPKSNSWEYSTANIVDNFVDVYTLSASIVNELKPKKELIIEAVELFKLVPRFEVVLRISTNHEHSTPAIGFASETVAFIGEIGAFIDIDTYLH